MEFKELIRETGNRIGLEDFEPDEQNICHLISEDMAITIEFIEEFDLILMSTAVCDIPPEANNDVELFRAIAEANFQYRKTYGSTISVDPATNRVHLFRYDRAYDWTPDDLLYVIGRVVSGVWSVRELVKEYGTRDALPKSSDTFLLASDFVLV